MVHSTDLLFLFVLCEFISLSRAAVWVTCRVFVPYAQQIRFLYQVRTTYRYSLISPWDPLPPITIKQADKIAHVTMLTALTWSPKRFLALSPRLHDRVCIHFADFCSRVFPPFVLLSSRRRVLIGSWHNFFFQFVVLFSFSLIVVLIEENQKIIAISSVQVNVKPSFNVQHGSLSLAVVKLFLLFSFSGIVCSIYSSLTDYQMQIVNLQQIKEFQVTREVLDTFSCNRPRWESLVDLFWTFLAWPLSPNFLLYSKMKP